MVSLPRRKPRSIIRGDQISPIQLKSYIERSNYTLFLIKHTYSGSSQAKWYLIQVYMHKSYPVTMRGYGVYHYQWYFIEYEYLTKHPTMRCQFCTETINNNQGVMLGNMLPIKPSSVHNLPQKNHTYVWYQDYISLEDHRLVVPLKFGKTGINQLKFPNIIEYKQWSSS